MATNTPSASEQITKEAVQVQGGEVAKEKVVAKLMMTKLQEGDARRALEDAKNNLTLGVDKSRLTAASMSLLDGDPVRQQTKRDAFVAAGENASTYLKTELTALPVPEQGKLRGQILTDVQSLAFLSEVNKKLDTPAKQSTFIDSILKDPGFRSRVNRRLNEVSTRTITEEDKKKKLTELQKLDPRATHEQAAGILEQELQDAMDNVVRDSFRDMIRDNLQAAEDVTTKEGDKIDAELQKADAAMTDKVSDKWMKRWDSKGAYDPKSIFHHDGGAITQDFDKFTQGGLEALFGDNPTPAEKRILSDADLKKKYEEQIGQMLILKRLRTGKLSTQDLYRIADASWMGADATARTEKLTDIITSHSKIQELLTQGQQEGWLQDKSGFLNWLKDPKNAGLSIGLLAALLAGVALGPGIPAIPVALQGMLVGGTVAGGAAAAVSGSARDYE